MGCSMKAASEAIEEEQERRKALKEARSRLSPGRQTLFDHMMQNFEATEELFAKKRRAASEIITGLEHYVQVAPSDDLTAEIEKWRTDCQQSWSDQKAVEQRRKDTQADLLAGKF